MDENKIKELKKSFKKIIEFGKEENFYCDINYISSKELRISLDKININVNKSSEKGIKIRVFDGEKFLEFASTNLKENNLIQKIKSLLEKAKKNQNTLKDKFELKIDEKIFEDDFGEKDSKEYTIEEIIDILKNYKEKISNLDKDIINVKIIFSKEIEEHIFTNKYKNLSQQIPLNFFAMIAFVNTNNGVKMVYESFVSNNFEIFQRADEKMEKFKEKIQNYKQAKKLNGTKFKVILSPHLSGLLAHESFGHGMEADTMMKDRALASKYLGEKIANENISIVDYPLMPGKNGHYYFDHEGNMAKKTYLVKNGIINTPMADTYSKSRLNLNCSSNSRFESFDHKNYVRMSNTYFEEGTQSFEELLKSIKNGIYIIDSNGGMEDPKGWGVQIQGCFGQKIENGKLVNEFYDGFSFTGFLPQIMKNIQGISNKIEIDGGGQCGKGHKEWVRVSEGGPHILINEVILG